MMPWSVTTPRDKVAECASYSVSIFICGDINSATKFIQNYCNKIGLCVTIEPVNYIFTGGNEMGMRIGLINYARFPKADCDIWCRAMDLAYLLKDHLNQGSFTVQDNYRSRFFSTRPEDIA